jgi:hypothetical protein
MSLISRILCLFRKLLELQVVLTIGSQKPKCGWHTVGNYRSIWTEVVGAQD